MVNTQNTVIDITQYSITFLNGAGDGILRRKNDWVCRLVNSKVKSRSSECAVLRPGGAVSKCVLKCCHTVLQ